MAKRYHFEHQLAAPSGFAETAEISSVVGVATRAAYRSRFEITN